MVVTVGEVVGPAATLVIEEKIGEIQILIDEGYVDCDFGALLELEAKGADLDIKPENVEVGTGL